MGDRAVDSWLAASAGRPLVPEAPQPLRVQPAAEAVAATSQAIPTGPTLGPDRCTLRALCILCQRLYPWKGKTPWKVAAKRLPKQTEPFENRHSLLTHLSLSLPIITLFAILIWVLLEAALAAPPIAVAILVIGAAAMVLGRAIGFDRMTGHPRLFLMAVGSLVVVLALIIDAIWPGPWNGPELPSPWLFAAAGCLLALAVAVLVWLWRPLTSRAIGFVSGGKVYLVFQGTTGFWQLLFTDGAVLPRGFPPLIHRGFAAAWRGLAPIVRRWLAALPAGSGSLVLTGHSLGGALACLAAYELSDESTIEAVVIFGAPRPGLFPFLKRYRSKPAGPTGTATDLGEITWRYTHGFDPVSWVPPWPLYHHLAPAQSVRAGIIRQDQASKFGERALDILDRLDETSTTGAKLPAWVDRLLNVLGVITALPFQAMVPVIVLFAALVLAQDIGEHDCRRYRGALRLPRA